MVQAAALSKGLVGLIPQLSALSTILPPATLAWKLDQLAEGSKFVSTLYSNVSQRVLLLIGDSDLLLPSADEGPRLKRLLPRCNLKVKPGLSSRHIQQFRCSHTFLFRKVYSFWFGGHW